jgi:hypothetical protein
MPFQARTAVLAYLVSSPALRPPLCAAERHVIDVWWTYLSVVEEF